MEFDGEDNLSAVNVSVDDNVTAVNSTILDYYKKFGRKRDLEQYFSLSTAQSEIRDPTGSFWRRMKVPSDSDSASGEKKSESSTEICRISIKCTVPDTEPSCSQDDNTKTKSDSISPPIITEDAIGDVSRPTDDEYVKSDDNHSQKSTDAILDTSTNKPFSPTSSITSQRKLEWDSLADVGYANETDRKASGSNLSTLERLALHQQYSNNDTQQDTKIGPPTAHSTPQDDNDKTKNKKGISKSTKFHKREVDLVEVNLPQGSEMCPTQGINVNLTKHISFNIERDGVTVKNVQKDFTVKPDTEATPQVKMDKEIQTTLPKPKDKSSSSSEFPKTIQLQGQGLPVLINLNALRKRSRRKKPKVVRRKLRSKLKLQDDKENLPVQEKSGEQVSEAESFEYMPGHIYNQSQMQNKQPKPSHAAGNKSSLESSGVLTTDSSKGSKLSLTKDLEKSINLLKLTLRQRYDDSNLKQKLIKEVVQKLLQSSYRGDDSTDFLSGLSFNSKKLGLSESNHTTTSTSDANNTGENSKLARPKKSILRVDKFNANAIASTSQSAPNLPSVSNSEKPVISNLGTLLTSSNTESDVSSRGKTSSDAAFAKTSSQELYQKYIEALRREEEYKKHLRDKQMFLKQKLVCSDTGIRMPARIDMKSQNRLKDLMNDLTRNNYDDGSGDASKLEGGSNSNVNLNRYNAIKGQRSHSVFTLSSGSDCQNKKSNLRKNEVDSPKAGYSKGEHYCCCPYHSINNKVGFTDSCVQVNLKPLGEHQMQACQVSTNITHVVSDNNTGEIKYVCLCNQNVEDYKKTDNILIYKCSRLDNKGIQSQDHQLPSCNIQSGNDCAPVLKNNNKQTTPLGQSAPFKVGNECLKIVETDNLETGKPSKSSQTNLPLNLLRTTCSDKSMPSGNNKKVCETFRANVKDTDNPVVHEAIRCIQTEISINPKISDPSLSDINIINDANCVSLIGEHYREISKSSIPDEFSEETTSEKVIGPDNLVNEIPQAYRPDLTSVKDNFTIPIEGTNMTLMVSIGANTGKASTAPLKSNQFSQSIMTKPIYTSEKETSLREECTKGVQSQEAAIFTQMDSNSHPPRLVNTLFTREGFFYNTHPSNKQVTPPLRTGTSSLGNRFIIQTNAGDDFLTAKCTCPESAKCKGTCGEGADCMKQKPVLRSVVDTGCMVNPTEITKRKCSCPETAKCGHECGDNADCMKKEIPRQFASKPSSPRKSKCTCPASSDCGGKCKDDAVCVKKQSPRPVLCATNTSSPEKKSKCTCSESADCKGDCDDDCIIKPCIIKQSKRPMLGASNKSTQKESKCTCPPAAGCKGVCDDDAPCVKNQSPRPMSCATSKSTQKESKCTCPASADCKGICDDDALCVKNQSPRPVLCTMSKSTQKESKCTCPVTTDCKGICDDDAPCVKKQSVRPIPIAGDKCTQKKSKCTCPASSDCKGICGDDAPCVKKQMSPPLLGASNKGTQKKSKCTCPEWKNCGGNCDDDAECIKQMSLPLRTIHVTTNQCSVEKSCPCPENSKCGGTCKEGADCMKQKLPSSTLKQACKVLSLPKKSNCKCPDTSKCGGVCHDDAECLKRKEMGTVTDEVKYNTYPKIINVTTNKLLFRSNTDTSDNDKDGCVQTDTVEVSNTKSQSERVTGCSDSDGKCETSSDDKKYDDASKDVILDMIQDITKRYSKKDIAKNQRKKCFKEIMTILNYLLDTEDCPEPDQIKALISSTSQATDTPSCLKSTEKESSCSNRQTNLVDSCTSKSTACGDTNLREPLSSFKICGCATDIYCDCDKLRVQVSDCNCCPKKVLVDKAVQLCNKKSKNKRVCYTESSDIPLSTEAPCTTSSDSATCRVLSKIKKECEKYHQKRCMNNCGFKKCEASSSTSVNCDYCKRIHYCSCRGHRCKGYRPKSCVEKLKKKCVAYNLIIQTSESMISEEAACEKSCKPLQNIIVKVPPKRQCSDLPFQEMSAKIEGRQSCCSPRVEAKCQRSRSLPNESGMSSADENVRRSQVCTVREYLERNRPDFVQQCSKRQNCLKLINEKRADERASRALLSLQLQGQLDKQSVLRALSEADLRRLARQLGIDSKRKHATPKLISEREMKKRSEKIYKSLPEVVQKKEDARKESIKRTNLLMANIFKKNLQKKTLSGAVNMSNYSTVVKI